MIPQRAGGTGWVELELESEGERRGEGEKLELFLRCLNLLILFLRPPPPFLSWPIYTILISARPGYNGGWDHQGTQLWHCQTKTGSGESRESQPSAPLPGTNTCSCMLRGSGFRLNERTKTPKSKLDAL